MSTVARQCDDVAERFAKDVSDHQLTVLRDDGLYRHLRFVRTVTNPGTGSQERSSSYWFKLITWPGHLAIDGDMGGFMFARTDDMFGFFRGSRINPGYWTEKLRGPVEVREYSEDKFREAVTDYVSSGPGQAWPGLADAVEQQIFADGAVPFEHDARAALDEFGFGDTYDAECHCGARRDGFGSYEAARLWAADGKAHGHDGSHWAKAITTVEGFRFTDTWELDFRDWSYPYLWCLHAIQWGIRQYDQRGTAPSADGAVTAPDAPADGETGREQPAIPNVICEQAALVLRQRPGDQPLPVPNAGPSMHDVVIADLDGCPGGPGAVPRRADRLREEPARDAAELKGRDHVCRTARTPGGASGE